MMGIELQNIIQKKVKTDNTYSHAITILNIFTNNICCPMSMPSLRSMTYQLNIVLMIMYL